MKPRFVFLFLSAVALLCGCADDFQYGSPYQCSFVYFASDHATSALSLSLDNPGQFCIVTTRQERGITHIVAVPNSGSYGAEALDVPMVTAKENDRLSYSHMGAGGRLIIGCTFSSLTSTPLRAYDGECRACLDELGRAAAPLDWSSDGQTLVCRRCLRTYNPNADGTVIAAQGQVNKPLYQYRIDLAGGRLWVHSN